MKANAISAARKKFRALPLAGRAAILAAAFLCVVLGTASCGARWAMRRDAKAYDRDPATGVVRGTEAVWLHPAPARDRGEAVLLVHGFMGSRKDFNDLGARLAAAGFHVRLVRLPGCGTNPVDCGKIPPEALKDAVREEFNAAQAQYGKVNLVGFSMGGVLGTLLAAERNDIARLVLVAPAYGVTYKWYYGLPPELWTYSAGYLLPYVPRSELFVKVNRPKNEVHSFTYHAMSTEASRTLITLAREARKPATLAKIQTPLLLIMAEGDEAASPKLAHAAFAEIGSADKSEKWFGARSNHQLLWDYDCEEAAQAIVDYLTAPETAAKDPKVSAVHTAALR